MSRHVLVVALNVDNIPFTSMGDHDRHEIVPFAKLDLHCACIHAHAVVITIDNHFHVVVIMVMVVVVVMVVMMRRATPENARRKDTVADTEAIALSIDVDANAALVEGDALFLDGETRGLTGLFLLHFMKHGRQRKRRALTEHLRLERS